MFDGRLGHWGHALWLSALGAAVGIAAIGGAALVVLLGAEHGTRPDSGLEWSLYTYLLLPATVGLALGALVVSARFYRGAFQILVETVSNSADGQARTPTGEH